MSYSPGSASSFDAASTTFASVGPILLYAISPMTTRMLIDISTSKIPNKSSLLSNIPHLLPASVRPSFIAAVSETNSQRVKSMPNSFLPPAMQGSKRSKEGVLLAGDAMNMRHPLTGGGMSVALNDAVILTELLGARGQRRESKGRAPAFDSNGGYLSPPDDLTLSTSSSSSVSSEADDDAMSGRGHPLYGRGPICFLEDWWDVRSRLQEWHWRRKGVATCVNVLAMALYSLFGGEGRWPFSV